MFHIFLINPSKLKGIIKLYLLIYGLPLATPGADISATSCLILVSSSYYSICLKKI